MEFRVLGPLEARVHDQPLSLGGTRPRVVLAALLLESNTVVPVERLVSAIWGVDPPGTPTAQIQAAVSSLRKTFAAAGDTDRIVTRSPGYLIRVERGELDLAEFDREIAAARRMHQEGAAGEAADALRAALAWWRDDALVDLAELPIRAATVAVDERRWVAWEERIEADLVLRRHADLVPELAALVTKKPLRDRLWGQLMRAQYQSGRRAEALETYQRARHVMLEELGLEPAAELGAVHRAILADDPALVPDSRPPGPRPERVRPPCPHRALTAYQPADAGSFFGRRTDIAAVLHRLRDGPVTVVGPSGSGKSSLVLAGVLAALPSSTALVVRPSAQGRVDLALAAAVAEVLPAGDLSPELTDLAVQLLHAGGLAEMVQRVRAHTGARRVVVVLDQAEELLTQDASLVDRFVAALFGPAPPDGLTVLATLRADVLDAVLERPALSGTLGGPGVYTLGAMSPEQLREAITGPIAELPGVGFQPGLVDRIVHDVSSEPGALALLGLTLTLLWDGQVDGTLTHQAYDDLGRVPGALATHAEGEWRRRNLAADQAAVRNLVGRLVQVLPGGQVTRRPVARAELDEPAWLLVERLATTRLLVLTGGPGGPAAELAHEALLTHWPRLSGWISEDIDFHLWRSELRADVQRWHTADRDPALLLRGAVLADARRRRAERAGDLSPDELDFLRRSEGQQRSTGRRSRVRWVALAAAVLVLAVVLVLQHVRTAATDAEVGSRALAAASDDAAKIDSLRAAMLAVAAYDRAPTTEAQTALFQRSWDVGRLDLLQPADDTMAGVVEASSDGRVVASLSENLRVVKVWVRDPGRPVRTLRFDPKVPVGSFAVAADGSAVWLIDDDTGIARLDVTTGEVRPVIRTDVAVTFVPSLSLSPDGARIVVDDRPDPGTRRVREFSTSDGTQLGSAAVPVGSGELGTVRPGEVPNSVLLETESADRSVRVDELNLATGRRSTLAAAPSGAVASDGSSVVTCEVAGDAYVLTGVRIADRAPIGRAVLHEPFPAPPNRCPRFVAGPRGRVVMLLGFTQLQVAELTTGESSAVKLFQAGDGALVRPVALTPDGSRLVFTTEREVGVLDVTVAENTTPALRDGRLLDDGRALLGYTDDGAELVIRPVVTGGPTATVPRATTFVSPAGPGFRVGRNLVADRVGEHTVALYRLPGLEPLRTLTLPDGELWDMVVDAGGQLETAIGDRIYWWDPASGELRRQLDLSRLDDPGSGDPRPILAPQPDPNLIAVAHRDRPGITVRDARDGHVVERLPVGDGITQMQLRAATGELLVNRSTTTEVWDTRREERVFGPLEVGEESFWSASLGPAGRIQVTHRQSDNWFYRSFDIGHEADPVSTVNLGPHIPITHSGDGQTVSFNYPSAAVTVAVRRLDPAGWRADLCTTLGSAEFDAADRAAFPELPPGPVCAATPDH